MPVYKCPNGKWRVGTGPCMYPTKEKAHKAYLAYLAKKHAPRPGQASESDNLKEQVTGGGFPVDELNTNTGGN